jgi:hypothetical protein
MNTINVIEMVDSGINRLTAFADTKRGNSQAERLFTKIIVENGCKKNDSNSYCDDGYFECGNYQVFLVHSTK